MIDDRSSNIDRAALYRHRVASVEFGMARRFTPLPWLLLLLLVLAGSWFWIAPHRAYDRFLQAVAFGSESGLAETVDLALVRQQLKEDLGAAVARQSNSQLGGTAAADFIDGAVDATLTPSGLADLITAFGTRAPGPGAADTLQTGTVVAFQYRSLSRVDVLIRAAGESETQSGILTFTRTGTVWRLSRIWSEQLLGTQGAP